jgi:hypothetical protein
MIERPWQSRGVGTELLERTFSPRANRGIRQLHIGCLTESQRMQQLTRKFDAELRRDCDCVIGEVEAPSPTPMSLMREMIADRHEDFDAQQRLVASNWSTCT